MSGLMYWPHQHKLEGLRNCTFCYVFVICNICRATCPRCPKLLILFLIVHYSIRGTAALLLLPEANSSREHYAFTIIGYVNIRFRLASRRTRHYIKHKGNIQVLLLRCQKQLEIETFSSLFL